MKIISRYFRVGGALLFQRVSMGMAGIPAGAGMTVDGGGV
jgi:hypothetical protein